MLGVEIVAPPIFFPNAVNDGSVNERPFHFLMIQLIAALNASLIPLNRPLAAVVIRRGKAAIKVTTALNLSKIQSFAPVARSLTLSNAPNTADEILPPRPFNQSTAAWNFSTIQSFTPCTNSLYLSHMFFSKFHTRLGSPLVKS